MRFKFLTSLSEQYLRSSLTTEATCFLRELTVQQTFTLKRSKLLIKTHFHTFILFVFQFIYARNQCSST